MEVVSYFSMARFKLTKSTTIEIQIHKSPSLGLLLDDASTSTNQSYKIRLGLVFRLIHINIIIKDS